MVFHLTIVLWTPRSSLSVLIPTYSYLGASDVPSSPTNDVHPGGVQESCWPTVETSPRIDDGHPP